MTTGLLLGHAAWGQRAGIVRIGGAAEAESLWLLSPERVWTLGFVILLDLPLESLPTALSLNGVGGRKSWGRNHGDVVLGRLVLLLEAELQHCGSINQELPSCSWTSSPLGSP